MILPGKGSAAMTDEEFEKIMDSWASHEIESAPHMRPTEKMYQMIQAKQKKESFFKRFLFAPPVRWATAGLVTASLIAFVVLYPILFPPSGQDAFSIGQRKGFSSKDGPIETPFTYRGGGPKKDQIPFKYIVFQYYTQGDQDVQDVKAVDIRVPQKKRIVVTHDENYRLFLQPARNCYVYIYQLDSLGQLGQLFPNETYTSLQNPLQQRQEYYFPSEPNWFYPGEHPGEERLYILASTQVRQDWEEQYAQYARAEDSQDKQQKLTHFLETIEAVGENLEENADKWVFTFTHQ